MKVVFSDKYQPLFQLLIAWSERDRISIIGLNESEIEEYHQLKACLKSNLFEFELNRLLSLFNDVCSLDDRIDIAEKEIHDLRVKGLDQEELKELDHWLVLAGVDTVLISGGRDSGKSFGLSAFNGKASRDNGHRILYTRQTMSSTDSSITEALENRLMMLGIAHDFEVANKIYKVKDDVDGNPRKGKIVITGQKTSVGTQTAKLKSLEDFSIFETDEGEELESFESWNKTKRSLRAQDVQCLAIISFNPPTRDHWIFDEFYEEVPEGFNGIIGSVMYIHTTYLDNGKENMAEHNWNEYEGLRLKYEQYESLTNEEKELADPKLKKAWSKYKCEILGGFKDIAEGVIYENWREGAFNEKLFYCYAIDFGFSDPDAALKIAVDTNEKEIYLDEVLHKNGLGTSDLGNILLDRCGHFDLLIGDHAQARLLNDLRDVGLNAEGCIKGVNSVKNTINTIKGYTIIVTPQSKNIKKALRNYCWNDKRAEVPERKYKHFPDAMGYGFTRLTA
jgi:phage terminase large subunit